MTDQPSGILVVDKPGGMSSHGVVGQVRRKAATRRVGHAGTLDPMATGVLVLGIGRGTRLLHYLVGADKEYAATIRLGWSTTTDDADGETLAQAGADELSEAAVRAAMQPLSGDLEQVPSAVSAIKVDGRRAYQRVRDGETVTLAPRSVRVTEFNLLRCVRSGPYVDADVHVSCSSGTYVRALARDLGESLGVGGHLTALRRTRVGPFRLADGCGLDDLPSPLTVAMLPLGRAATQFLPERVLGVEDASRVRHGVPPGPSGTPGPVALLDPTGALLAVAQDAGPRADLRAVFVG